MRRWLLAAAGHRWTIAAGMHTRSAGEDPIEFDVADAAWGSVRVRGRFHDAKDSDTLVVIVPGIAGNADTGYLLPAARAAERRGFAHLRLGMRGTDLSGEDIWHGGLTDDLRAALASGPMKRFARVLLFGYSVGGHVALRAAIERIDPRIRAVAAVSAPLDLELGTRVFDAPACRPYRRRINAALDRIYAHTAARRPLLHPTEVVQRARSSRHRDALTIVPRYGFRSAEDYYARASVAPILGELEVPGLYVGSRFDPIVVPSTVEPALASASPALSVKWLTAGGHVGFPPRLALEEQVVRWLEVQ